MTTEQAIKLALLLAPYVKDIIVKVVDRINETKGTDITIDDLLNILDESKSQSWPELNFESPNKED